MLDPAPYRALFPITQRATFLNHASVSPLNTRAVAAIQEYATGGSELTFSEFIPKVFGRMGDLRERLARLINARSVDEIVLMPNTATGVNTAALSLPLKSGDNVLVLDGDYPANVYPWMNLAHRGVLTKVVPSREGGLDLDLLASRIDSRTRAVALSTVQFATGFRNDIVAAGRLCKERGIYFSVDGIQSLGALPLDVQEAGIDFLACGSQKWMLGPLGSGFLYVRRELLDELAPGAYVGTSSVVDWANFLDYNLTLLPTAERFALGTPNVVGAFGLHASLSLIQEAGVQEVGERVLALAGTAIDALRERGFRFSASTAPEHRSGIVIVEVDQPDQVAKRLEEAGVIVIPRGRGVRLSPHFYNTEDEVLQVVELLDQVARG